MLKHQKFYTMLYIKNYREYYNKFFSSTCNEDECIELVRQAIKQGINYIDTAPWYGQGRSEALLGKVRRIKLFQKSYFSNYFYVR